MKSRHCTKCGELKHLTEFNKCAASLDGHGLHCRVCTKAAAREYRNIHRDSLNARRPPYHSTRYKWRADNPLKCKQQRKRYRAAHPERVRAGRLLLAALRKGTVTRSSCTQCGNVKSQAHHPDYSKPLEVIWLCYACHKAEHKRLLAIAKGSK